MKIGDSILCEGPFGKLRYFGYGDFHYMKKQLPNKTKVGLIAGGTGITPLFSLAQASCLANDKLNIKLIYSNKTKKDVLLHKELSQLSQ